jgi:hypothetical protein
MRINDDDIATGIVVSAETLGEEAVILFFRRSGSGLEMAGFWN